MKKTVVLVMVVLMAMASTAFGAATVSYEQSSFTLTVNAGETVTDELTMSTTGQRGRTVSINLAGEVTGGNLPAAWIDDTPVALSKSSPTTATLSITVPDDAAEDTYYGVVIPAVVPGREAVDAGDGFYVSVDVKSSCKDDPMFKGMMISPDEVSARNNKAVEVIVTGNVTVSQGCELSAVKFTVDDEYDEFDASGPVEVDENGNFMIKASVNASRRGSDKDGRVYSITVTAEDMKEHCATEEFFVNVAHDSGNGDDASGDKGANDNGNGNGKALGKDK